MSEPMAATSTAGRYPPSGTVVQGGAAFGNLYRPTSSAQVRDALDAAWGIGVRAFDTAPHYGVGLSEERMGSFLATRPRSELTVSTKVGRLLVDDADAPTAGEGFAGTPQRRRVRDYSADGVRRSIEESLVRLGLDRVDLVLIHDPEDHLDAAVTEAAPALSALRAEGVIGGYGVGTNFTRVALRLVQETDLDTLMIAGRYTLVNSDAEGSLLPTCLERGINVLTAGVFNSGLLADPGAADPHYDYGPAPAELVATAERMEQACRDHGVALRAAALQFPLRHPAVTAVVLGAGTAAEVHDCHDQLSVRVPEELWGVLDRLRSG